MLKSIRTRAAVIIATMILAISAATTETKAQTYTVLYNFGINSGDPNDPQYSAVIAEGPDGNLYSTIN